MNKAVLVIDMPISCKECPLSYDSCSGYYCGALKKDYEIEEITAKKHNCPLKRMPLKNTNGMDKIKVVDCVTFSEEFYNQAKHQIEQRITYDVNRLIAKGFDDCIDEILGGNNDR